MRKDSFNIWSERCKTARTVPLLMLGYWQQYTRRMYGVARHALLSNIPNRRVRLRPGGQRATARLSPLADCVIDPCRVVFLEELS
jgi:hypothetical protein